MKETIFNRAVSFLASAVGLLSIAILAASVHWAV